MALFQYGPQLLIVATYLLVPSQKYAPADVSPSRKSHTFVEVFHKGVLRVGGQSLDRGGNFGGLGGVENGE